MKAKQSQVVGLDDLGQLTLRANVAFAVRCAQRIRPCFRIPPDAPRRREQIAAVDGAIRIATAFCQDVATEPGQAAAAARTAEVVAEETYEFTNCAGFAAVRAAEAAAHAEALARGPVNSDHTEVVAAAFGAGRVLAANADMFALDAVANALYADVEKLLKLAHGASGLLGAPVDPSESGPLGPFWPDGPPACYAE
jgi:hypothetical protein